MFSMLANVAIDGEYICGAGDFAFSGTFPFLVSLIIKGIQIVVPVLLVIFGMLDLGKAVVASKEDEIKKGQQLLIKRAISAALVFFIITIVQLIINFVASAQKEDDATLAQCFNCFVRGKEGSNACKPYNGGTNSKAN